MYLQVKKNRLSESRRNAGLWKEKWEGKSHILCLLQQLQTYDYQTNTIVRTQISKLMTIARTQRPDFTS